MHELILIISPLTVIKPYKSYKLDLLSLDSHHRIIPTQTLRSIPLLETESLYQTHQIPEWEINMKSSVFRVELYWIGCRSSGLQQILV